MKLWSLNCATIELYQLHQMCLKSSQTVKMSKTNIYKKGHKLADFYLSLVAIAR
jgi:hypothetical protein